MVTECFFDVTSRWDYGERARHSTSPHDYLTMAELVLDVSSMSLHALDELALVTSSLLAQTTTTTTTTTAAAENAADTTTTTTVGVGSAGRGGKGGGGKRERPKPLFGNETWTAQLSFLQSSESDTIVLDAALDNLDSVIMDFETQLDDEDEEVCGRLC